jgi:hypothetical protein
MINILMSSGNLSMKTILLTQNGHPSWNPYNFSELLWQISISGFYPLNLLFSFPQINA